MWIVTDLEWSRHGGHPFPVGVTGTINSGHSTFAVHINNIVGVCRGRKVKGYILASQSHHIVFGNTEACEDVYGKHHWTKAKSCGEALTNIHRSVQLKTDNDKF